MANIRSGNNIHASKIAQEDGYAIFVPDCKVITKYNAYCLDEIIALLYYIIAFSLVVKSEILILKAHF